MKVIFLNRYFHPDFSASSQLLSDLAFSLANEDIDVTVITSQQRYDNPNAALPSHETVNKVNIVRVATPSNGRQKMLGRVFDYLGFYFAASVKLFKLANKNTIIVVNTDPPLMSVPACLVSVLKKSPMINWLHDLYPEVATALGVKGFRFGIARPLRYLRNCSLKSAVMNVVIHANMRNSLIRQGIPAEKITVINNWGDGKNIMPVSAESNPLRKKWHCEEKFVMMYSGNLGLAHDYLTLLNAAEKLRDDNDIIFFIIGDGSLALQLQTEVKNRQLKNILFKPYQDRESLRFSLSLANIHLVMLRPELEGLVFPSKYYTVTAAGRGCIYIGDTNASLSHEISQTNSGRATPMGDSQALSDIIREIKKSRIDTEMGKNARELFEKKYDYPTALQKWRRVLNNAQ